MNQEKWHQRLMWLVIGAVITVVVTVILTPSVDDAKAGITSLWTHSAHSANPIMTSTSPPTAQPTLRSTAPAALGLNGTWKGVNHISYPSTDTWNLKQSGSSITGTGQANEDGSLYQTTEDGSINGNKVMITQRFSDSNCIVSYTLTLNIQNGTEKMDGQGNARCASENHFTSSFTRQ